MNREIQEELGKILDETTKLSFPIFSSKEEKKRILIEVKSEIEKRIIDCLDAEGQMLFEGSRKNIWEESVQSALAEFDTLPEKIRLNSFYLQEVMHRYVEGIIELF